MKVKIMSEIKLGTRLKAINECRIYGLKECALTVGKTYRVIETRETEFAVKDNQNTNHYFDYNGAWDFFQVNISKNPK